MTLRDSLPPPSTEAFAIAASGVRFRYPSTGFELKVDRLEIAPGEAVGLFGPSGSGKSTLLDLIAGVLVPDEGTVRVDGEALEAASETRRRTFRARTIGFVFQDFPLVEYLDTLENVLYPYRISRALRLDRTVRDRALALLERLGLARRAGQRPAELSAGERQRVAIARALVTEPPVVLADEPTAGLDPARSAEVVELLLELARRDRRTLLVVSHDASVSRRLDRQCSVVELATGPSFDDP